MTFFVFIFLFKNGSTSDSKISKQVAKVFKGESVR